MEALLGEFCVFVGLAAIVGLVLTAGGAANYVKEVKAKLINTGIQKGRYLNIKYEIEQSGRHHLLS